MKTAWFCGVPLAGTVLDTGVARADVVDGQLMTCGTDSLKVIAVIVAIALLGFLAVIGISRLMEMISSEIAVLITLMTGLLLTAVVLGAGGWYFAAWLTQGSCS